jgi:hypothetical protein
MFPILPEKPTIKPNNHNIINQFVSGFGTEKTASELPIDVDSLPAN